jgi:hypothetical protein
MVTSPSGERLAARVGQYHGADNGFEVRLNMAGGYSDGLSVHLQRQGWKIPDLQTRNVRSSELQKLTRLPEMQSAKTQSAQRAPKAEPPHTRPPMSQHPDQAKREEFLAKRRKASAMRHSVAHESAKQVVNAMLDEDYAFGGDGREEFEKRAGGAKDPWRQGNLGKFSFKGAKFTGKRPNLGAAPAKPGTPAKPSLGKHGSRMSWKPGEAAPAKPGASPKPNLGKDRMKWKPTQENIVPGTASSGAAPAMSMDVPDPDKESEGVADTGPKMTAGPANTPSAGGAASLFGP